MAINGIQSVGDDQRWKEEVERQIKLLQDQISLLKNQTNARSQ